MPLLDHFFQPANNPRANWESFHHRWATSIADHLDQILPQPFFARVEIHLGREVAADIGEFESLTTASTDAPGNGTALQTYTPPTATLVMPDIEVDETEIQIRESSPSTRLLAVIEIVNPSNKHGTDERAAFAAKCAAYLQNGIGLVIVDAVTIRHFNLHNELVRLRNLDESYLLPNEPPIYIVSYQPTHRKGEHVIYLWPHVLRLGHPLPLVPLALKGFGCIPLDMELTYMETCHRTRLL